VEDIRAYVAAVEKRQPAKTAASHWKASSVSGSSGRGKADWIDPILNAECPVLDEE